MSCLTVNPIFCPSVVRRLPAPTRQTSSITQRPALTTHQTGSAGDHTNRR